jgi:hypothetical protein
MAGANEACINAGWQVCGRVSAVAGIVPDKLTGEPPAGTGVLVSIDDMNTMHRIKAQRAAIRHGMDALVFLSGGTGDHLHEWLTFSRDKGISSMRENGLPGLSHTHAARHNPFFRSQ